MKLHDNEEVDMLFVRHEEAFKLTRSVLTIQRLSAKKIHPYMAENIRLNSGVN